MFYKLKGISSFSQESRTESGCKSGRISYVIVQIRDGGLYRDFKVRVLFEKASLFNAQGLCNPGKVRRRVFELTSQTYCTFCPSLLENTISFSFITFQ